MPSKKPFKMPEVGDRFRIIHSSHKFNGDYLVYEVFKVDKVLSGEHERAACWRVDELNMQQRKRETATFMRSALEYFQDNQMLMRLNGKTS